MQYYLIDFFCGCGGTSLGFQQAGWDIAMGIDIDKRAYLSYKSNFPNATFINKDIAHITKQQFLRQLTSACPNYKNGKVAFSICAPCQPFSMNNRNRLHQEDTRLNLLDSCIKFIDLIQPDFIFLENVPGMKLNKQQGPFAKFLQYLENNNYGENHYIINACDYGVPQSRKRLVLIACKGQQQVAYPMATHGDICSQPHITVRDTIYHLPPIQAGYPAQHHPLHQSRGLSNVNSIRLRSTPENGGSRSDWPQYLHLNCHKKTSGFGNVYGRMWWDKPAPTLTTKCTSISCGRFGHPKQDRAITLLEALLLQSFPKNYTLMGNFEDKARQIGNAVPPKLAKVFAEHLKNMG